MISCGSGSPGSPGSRLVERGWILAIVAAVLCVALAAGWTCLRLLRGRPGRHAAGDVAVFARRGTERRVAGDAGAWDWSVRCGETFLPASGWCRALFRRSVYFRGGCASGTCEVGMLRAGRQRRRRLGVELRTGCGSGCRSSWRSCCRRCCRRSTSTCASITCKRQRSSTRPDGSRFCRTTCMPTCRWAARCWRWRAWSSPAIGGSGRWRARR